MMEQDLGTRNHRRFSILEPLLLEQFPIISTAMLGKLWPGSHRDQGYSHVLLWLWLS